MALPRPWQEGVRSRTLPRKDVLVRMTVSIPRFDKLFVTVWRDWKRDFIDGKPVVEILDVLIWRVAMLC